MKKSISLLLSVILVVAMTSFSFASDLKNVTDDTKYVEPSITIQKVNENILKNISAQIILPDGEIIPLDVEVETTMEPNSDNFDLFYEQNAFVFKSTARTSSSKGKFNKKWHDGIDAEAEIVMKWIDKFGTKNKITHLSGTCTVNKGTFLQGWVYWGDHTAVGDAPNKDEVGDYFDFDVDFTSHSYWGTVRADYKVYVKSPKSNTNYDICVTVNPLG
jgi:hypothetical protein